MGMCSNMMLAALCLEINEHGAAGIFISIFHGHLAV
jgi:hypothetical protein